MKEKEKLGIALVGLGTYSEKQLAPALKETKHCYLAGVVTGSQEKSRKWKAEYNLKDENIYTYESFDDIRNNDDIDIVYVVLPNSMHAEYVIKAARAGKHVICEKPMATSVEDCKRMIEACNEAGVRLSIGYRLHFDPFNQEMMRLGQGNTYGELTSVTANNGMDVGEKDQWRLKQSLAGGGPLMDVGIYCVQGVIYTVGELPIAVTAKFLPKTDHERFAEVEEGIEWQMEFRSGLIASCKTSYKDEYNILRADAANGWFTLEPAYEYGGLEGETSEGKMDLVNINQQAAQMDDFAVCIKTNQETRVPGEMGARDVEILLAIYEAARSGRRVELHLETYQQMVEM